MEFAPSDTVHNFTITAHDPLPEIDGEAIVGIHEPSGARLLVLSNDDANKSFAIGFRTPPQDDTGVFHILEHSVLCGSRRFPVKEPFVDLLKGSMQTFLNAMTFADKTLYPVASTNEQDLFNLMDVYLDAVFHPNIYEKRAIFEQEGWHYELRANATGDEGAKGNEAVNPAELPADQTTLVHNGVVFNEMKGALSDASSVLYDEVQAALFPGTCYAFESGGTPKAIPTLTYEGYLDEHRRHYRTDNSYIILYGNLDITRALAFLDERYLTPVAAEQRERDEQRAREGLEPLVPRTIQKAAGPAGTSSVTLQLGDRCGGSATPLKIDVPAGIKLPEKAITPQDAPYIRKTMDTAAENACAACGYVIGDASDYVRSTAAEILLDALFGSNESPLKRALLDAGVAHDVHAFVSDSLLQPFAIVQLQMPAEGAGLRLAHTVDEETRKLLDAGLDRELVEAALSHAEFQMREHDMGTADGVIHSMLSLSSWLYDDDAPLDYLRYERLFAELREKLEEGYFEQLAFDLLCANDHVAAAEVVPTPGVSDDDAAEQLAELNRSLSPEERQRIVREEELLRERQMAPDSPEAIATLPRLGIADLDEEPAAPAYALDADAPLACVRHDLPTHGIAYAYRYFDADCLEFDDLPYLSVLAQTLGKLDTAHHTAAEIDTLTQGKLGNLAFYTEVFEHLDDPAKPKLKFVASASSLSGNVDWLARLPREVLLETDFSNTDKILNVLQQRKIGLEHAFANNGHTCASTRCKSYYAESGVLLEQLRNVEYYRFLCDLLEHFDERKQALSARLAAISTKLFCDDRCTVSFAGTDGDYRTFWENEPGCGRTGNGVAHLIVPKPAKAREAFIVPTDVCYAATGWDRRLINENFTGTWLVAARALSYDYLWNEVRVKGGAYGTGFSAMWAGNMRFYSYRDPHLDETLARFGSSVDWLGRFDPSQEDLEGFIVATVATLDAPKKPRDVMRRQIGDYFTGRNDEQRATLRREVIETTTQAVRDLAPALGRVVDQQAICTFGNRDILEGSQADFEVITLVG